MKTKIIFLITVLGLVSCSKSNEGILNKVSSNLNNLQTVKYLSVTEAQDNGQIVFKSEDTLSFDFTNGLKYYFSSEKGELLYNGNKMFFTIPKEKIIVTSDDNRPEIVNNLVSNTLHHLKGIFPKIIKDKSIITSRKNDTVINNNQHLVFSFLLQKRYIDWATLEFKQGIDYDSEYILMVDKKNYLPYKIISPNGKQGSISSTIENVELDKEFSDKLWTGKSLPKDYARFTKKEYYTNNENILLNNLGKELTDWELPELTTNNFLKTSQLKGNVTLLEFWFKGCGGCIAAIPSLNNIKTRFEKDNFKIYGVEFIENFSKEKLENYIEEQNILYPNLFKGKTIAIKYGIRSAPTFMIINKKGTIIHIKNGFSEENMTEIIDIIEKNI